MPVAFVAETLRGLGLALPDPEIGEIAARMDWVEVPAGRRLLAQDERGECLYVLVSGRLRAVVRDDAGGERVVGEISRGDVVGEIALLTDEPRSASIDAIRDSLLARLTRPVFEELAARSPAFAVQLSRVVIRRLARSQRRPPDPPRIETVALLSTSASGAGTGRAGASVRGVHAFGARLAAALGAHGPVLRVDAARVRAAGLDPHAADEREHARLTRWLDEQAEAHRFVLYEPDAADTPWTRRCLRQADRVLIVAPADGDPVPGALETALLGVPAERGGPASDAVELVLLHDDGSRMPSGTRNWLAPRRLARHHHVRQDRDGDVERIARFLAGRAVGLVLAGGGARGLAHVGAVRALREARVPVDLVAGTSIGALVGAAVAMDWDHATTHARLRAGFTSGNPITDYDPIPIAALVRGRRLEARLREYSGEHDIADLWIPFLCVSSNLGTESSATHRTGTVWRAVRASLSIPGVLPPVVIDGQLHVDGGTFDNLPVDAAIDAGAGRVIACALQHHQRATVPYDETPPGWRLFVDRHITRKRRYPVPGIIATVIRGTVLASTDRARRAEARADLVLRLPVETIGFVAWDAFDRAEELGYAYTAQALRDGAQESLLAR